MQKLFLFLLLFSSSISYSQNACDSLQIVHVNVDAFVSNQLNITVSNNNAQQIFDYPGFRVYDENNNLIGEEEVFFFGIAGESTHSITFDTTAFQFIEGQEYNLTLELWTGFYDAFACEYQVSATLIPTLQECIPVSIIFFEYSSEQVSYHWQLTDYWGDIIQDETLVFAEDVGSITRNVCLDQSCFYLSASSTLQPELSTLYINVIADVDYGFISSPLLNMSNDSTMLFSIWSDCSLINSREEINEPSFELFPNPSNNHVTVRSQIQGAHIIRIMDLNGKEILKQNSNSPLANIDISVISKGVYVIELQTKEQTIRKKFIKN